MTNLTERCRNFAGNKEANDFIVLTKGQKDFVFGVISSFMDLYEEEFYERYHGSQLIADADYAMKILDDEIDDEEEDHA